MGPEKIKPYSSAPHSEPERLVMDLEMQWSGKKITNLALCEGDRRNPKVGNVFLRHLEGLVELNNIILVSTTNRKELFDKEAKRVGRLGVYVEIKLPDVTARKEIFEIHLRAAKEAGDLHPDIDLGQLAEAAKDFTGMDIVRVIQEACQYPLRRLE